MNNSQLHASVSRNNILELVKLILALFVMLIHTHWFSEKNIFLWQFDAVLRLAVPFFIMLNGYFLAKKLSFSDGRVTICQNNRKIFFRYLQTTGIRYGFWSLLYLAVSIPSWISSGWFSPFAFFDWIVAFFIKGSYFHLWYLLYLLYAIFIFWLIGRIVPVKLYPLLAIPLYLIEVLQYGYRQISPSFLQPLFPIFDTIPAISALTRVLPFFLFGVYLYFRPSKRASLQLFCFFVSFLLLVIERNFLLSHDQLAVSYIFFMLPAAVFFFQNILSLSQKKWSPPFVLPGRISNYIYFIHPFFLFFADILPVSSFFRCIVWMTLSIVTSYFLAKKRVS